MLISIQHELKEWLSNPGLADHLGIGDLLTVAGIYIIMHKLPYARNIWIFNVARIRRLQNLAPLCPCGGRGVHGARLGAGSADCEISWYPVPQTANQRCYNLG